MKITLAEVEKLTKSELVGNPDYIISEVADLDSATAEQASFFSNPNYTNATYAKNLLASNAGVIFVKKGSALKEGRQYLLTDDPSLAFQKLLEYLRPEIKSGFNDISSASTIHKSVKLGKNIQIAPGVVIDRDSVIGDDVTISANVTIGAETSIGDSCRIYPNVTIREGVVIGSRVIIQPGAVIGSCGYGYHTDRSNGTHRKLKQLGNVVIKDDVEIGANTTIDRARLGSTVIGKGTKIDNLVQIAHGVKIGPNNLIVAQVGIAGSTQTGNCVIIGGQAGLNGHISIADFVQIASRTVVTKNIPKAGVYSGSPAVTLKEHQKRQIAIKRIAKKINLL